VAAASGKAFVDDRKAVAGFESSIDLRPDVADERHLCGRHFTLKGTQGSEIRIS
jgi:hypothetical protein